MSCRTKALWLRSWNLHTLRRERRSQPPTPCLRARPRKNYCRGPCSLSLELTNGRIQVRSWLQVCSALPPEREYLYIMNYSSHSHPDANPRIPLYPECIPETLTPFIATLHPKYPFALMYPYHRLLWNIPLSPPFVPYKSLSRTETLNPKP